jgi:hypothetical protein
VQYVLFQSCNESITSIHGGVVGSAGYEEVVASTYTGNIYLFISFFTYCIFTEQINSC